MREARGSANSVGYKSGEGGASSLGQAAFSDVQFAVSTEPESAPLRITQIPPNMIVSITFTSDENKLYTIFRSVGFGTPVDLRVDVDDSIPGAAGSETTTFPIDYNVHGIPLDTPAQFFVVKENASATP